MMRQIVAIERTRGFLKALDFHTDHRAALRSSVLVGDALASVNIEGAQVSLETAFALARDEAPVPQTAGEAEFLNYLRAFEDIETYRGERSADWRDLKTGDLLNLHRTVVDGVRGGSRYAGRWRTEDVVIGDRLGNEKIVHHTPVSHFQVAAQVEELLDWINGAMCHPSHAERESGATDSSWVHPVIVAGVAHHRLVWIHPFVDGNGRTSRMFTNLMLWARGYDFKYLFDLSSYYNRDRDRYYAALREADREGDYTAWLEYFMGGFANQMFTIEAEAKQLALGAQN